MGVFSFEERKVNLFIADCTKELNETVANLGAIAAKKNITNEDLMKSHDIAIAKTQIPTENTSIESCHFFYAIGNSIAFK